MESPTDPPRIRGPVVHAWGPFRVRVPTTAVTEGYAGIPLSWHVVSIMLSPENEQTIGTINNVDISLPGLVKTLRKQLQVLEHSIAVWDQHLRELQQPERMAALQAQLDEEAKDHERNADDEQVSDTGEQKQEESFSAPQVLRNQQHERQRLQKLHEAIQAGLRELQVEFPDLGSDNT